MVGLDLHLQPSELGDLPQDDRAPDDLPRTIPHGGTSRRQIRRPPRQQHAHIARESHGGILLQRPAQGILEALPRLEVHQGADIAEIHLARKLRRAVQNARRRRVEIGHPLLPVREDDTIANAAKQSLQDLMMKLPHRAVPHNDSPFARQIFHRVQVQKSVLLCMYSLSKRFFPTLRQRNFGGAFHSRRAARMENARTISSGGT